MEIRKARVEECDLLSELAVRSKAYWPYDKEFIDAARDDLRLDRRLVERGLVYVAESEGDISGYYALEDSEQAEMVALFVEPKVIGQGIGRKLWKHATNVAVSRGWDRFIIVADPYAADNFYAKIGCKKIGEVDSPVIEDRKLPLFEYCVESPLSERAKCFWERYVATQDVDLAGVNVEATMAGNAEITDKLIALYLAGKKTAGSGLVKDYQHAGDDLPEVGNYWIVLDSSSEPKCVLKTIRVEICPFQDVSESVAVAEGEGDLSLEYWREAHRKFFTPFLDEWGVTDLDQEDVITEFFDLVFR